MGVLLGVLDFICLILICASIICFAVSVLKKKSKKVPIITFVTSFALLIVFTFIAVTFFPISDKTTEVKTSEEVNANNIAEKKKQDNVENNDKNAQKQSKNEKENDKHKQEPAKKQEPTKDTALNEQEKKQELADVQQSPVQEPEPPSEDEAIETEPSVNEEKTQENEKSQEVDVSSLSEDEYKNMCEILWYDEIFFSKDSLEGKYVRLDLFVEEWRFFNNKAAYDVFATDFINKYNLQREFYKCGVQRENENSYVGGQITMYFTNENGYSASDMTEGDHLIAYGEIIEYSTLTNDGYNSCSFLPKYIENNGQ